MNHKIQTNHCKQPRMGDIYLMAFHGIGSEQKGVRPGVILQNDIGNQVSPNTVALPLTTRLKNLNQPTHVLLSANEYNLAADSVVLCENPQRMSKTRLIKYLGKISKEDMKRVAVGTILASASVALLNKEELLEAWESSKRIQENGGECA